MQHSLSAPCSDLERDEERAQRRCAHIASQTFDVDIDDSKAADEVLARCVGVRIGRWQHRDDAKLCAAPVKERRRMSASSAR
eukprot:7310882-Prymnesium_polylepis.2